MNAPDPSKTKTDDEILDSILAETDKKDEIDNQLAIKRQKSE